MIRIYTIHQDNNKFKIFYTKKKINKNPKKKDRNPKNKSSEGNFLNRYKIRHNLLPIHNLKNKTNS